MSVAEIPEVDVEAATGEIDLNTGPWRDLWRRFRHQRIAMTGLVFLVLLLLVAVFAPWIAPHDPDEIQKAVPPGGTTALPIVNEGPSSEYWLGTDDVGHDILSRVIYGARVTVRAALQIVGLAALVALPLGLVAGYAGGWAESVIMRSMDAIFTFPPLILALSVTALIGANEPSLNKLFLAIAIVFVPGFVRLIRGQVLAVREETFIEAARSVGSGSRRIIFRHVLPNVASPLVVQVALSFGFAVLIEAGLSFLGLGAPQNVVSWGQMLNRAYNFILESQWQLIPPGLAIFFTVLAFNVVGDGLRDALGRDVVTVDR